MVMTLQKDLTPSDVVLSCFHFRHLGLHYWMVPTKKFIPPHSADFYSAIHAGMRAPGVFSYYCLSLFA